MMNLFLVVSSLLIVFASSLHESFNFLLPPLKRECFYEDFPDTTTKHSIEAFVLSGGTVDVVLTVHGPLEFEDVVNGLFENPILREKIDATIETQSESQTFKTEFLPNDAGTYAICLDNRNSRFTPKTVQLDVYPTKQQEEKLEVKAADIDNSEIDASKLESSLKSLNSILQGLNIIQLQQKRDRIRLNLHSEANTSNYREVFYGSIFETAIFVGVSLFQIFFVRRWFAARNQPGTKNWA